MDPDSSPRSHHRAPSFSRRRGLILLAIPAWLPLAISTGTVIELGILLGLLVVSGFFSGSEVALFSLGPAEREALSEDDSAASRRVLRLLERPRRLLITILLMNNLVNVLAAILATVMTVRFAQTSGIDQSPFGAAALFVGQVVVLTFFILVFSEITPKLVATRRSIAFSRAVAMPLGFLMSILAPLTSGLAAGMERLQLRVRTPSPMMSSEDLKRLADMGESTGTLEEEEAALIHSIVEFGDTTVREVMISRVDVHALPETATLDEAFDLIRSTGHSRFPLFREHLDNVVGILYAKDLIPYLNGNGSVGRLPDWGSIVRPAKFVPLGRKLDDMLADFQASGTHIAVVVDEYGGTAGVVSLEDILEEIVGEIRDEHDQPEEVLYEQIAPRTYRVDAGIDLDDLNDELHAGLETDAFDFETLGGLILHLVGDIPEEGTTAEIGRMRMRVEALDNNRITRVIVEILPVPIDATPDSAHGE